MPCVRAGERGASDSEDAHVAEEVMAYIDGTQDVRAHGDPVMPVWGEEFRTEAGWDMGRRVEVQGKLLLITNYVRSLQAH